jgi:hypothetical protein
MPQRTLPQTIRARQGPGTTERVHHLDSVTSFWNTPRSQSASIADVGRVVAGAESGRLTLQACSVGVQPDWLAPAPAAFA